MSVLTDNLDVFGRGFAYTLLLFVVSASCSLVLGTVLGVMRVSPVPVLRAAGTSYVVLLRNTPLTLVFFFMAFAFPLLEIVPISLLTSAMIALTIYTSAFVCETVRSGINTVAVGQAEAARALGLGFWQSLASVILPQATRAVVPPMMSVMIALLKNTTIASGFSVAEAGAIRAYLSERGEPPLPVLLWVAAGFLLLVLPLSLLQRRLERSWAILR